MLGESDAVLLSRAGSRKFFLSLDLATSPGLWSLIPGVEIEQAKVT